MQLCITFYVGEFDEINCILIPYVDYYYVDTNCIVHDRHDRTRDFCIGGSKSLWSFDFVSLSTFEQC